jgi:ParB-like chromosome segregation protein Spo0J
MIKVNILQVKPNPKNPRVIKDAKFQKLVTSIKEFPDMLNKRPLIVFTDVDGKYCVLGGNMRLKALNELKYTEIPIIVADEWTEEQKAEFLIKDNVGFGEWDWDQLANEWDAEKLDDWGLDLPIFNNADYSGKNEEIDIDLLDSEMILKLKYTEDDYNLVREQLSKIASTPEQAIWKLLGNE